MASVSHNDVEGVRVVSLRGTLDHEGVRPVEAAFESETPPGAHAMRKRQPWNASSTTQRFSCLRKSPTSAARSATNRRLTLRDKPTARTR